MPKWMNTWPNATLRICTKLWWYLKRKNYYVHLCKLSFSDLQVSRIAPFFNSMWEYFLWNKVRILTCYERLENHSVKISIFFQPNWFHVKCECRKNSLISTLWNVYLPNQLASSTSMTQNQWKIAPLVSSAKLEI